MQQKKTPWVYKKNMILIFFCFQEINYYLQAQKYEHINNRTYAYTGTQVRNKQPIYAHVYSGGSKNLTLEEAYFFFLLLPLLFFIFFFLLSFFPYFILG